MTGNTPMFRNIETRHGLTATILSFGIKSRSQSSRLVNTGFMSTDRSNLVLSFLVDFPPNALRLSNSLLNTTSVCHVIQAITIPFSFLLLH